MTTREPVLIGDLARRILASGRAIDFKEQNMSREIVPIRDLSRRAPEHGRIRIGVKTPNAMKSIDTLRFTSADPEAIETIASLYGGESLPWNDGGKRQEYEVITEVNEVPVILPMDPLGNTPTYELWSGGGIQRSCDGVTVEIPQSTQDGVEMVDNPCICKAKGKMDCRVITRLSVFLPAVKFAGTWRLETKSWNAAHELPDMVDAIMAVQGRGFTKAVLGVAKRDKVEAGKKRHFVVPYLRLDASMEELASGATQLRGIPSTTDAVGDTSPAAIGPGDGAVEVVSSENPPAPGTEDPAAEGRSILLEQLAEIAKRLKLRETDAVAFASYVSEGRCRMVTELDDEQLARIATVFGKLDRGECIFRGVGDDGKPIVTRLQPREESA